MSDSKQRKLGVILTYVSIIVNTLIQLLYTPLLIRMLGQSEYGLYSLVANIIGYLAVLDLGFGNAIIIYTVKYREQKKYEEEKKLHGMFKIVYIIIGIIAAILGLVLFFGVDSIFGNTMTDIELHKMKIMMLILSVNMLITFSFNIYSSIVSAYEKFVFQKIRVIIGAILKPLLMIPLLFMGYKSIALCIVITAVNIFIVLSNYFYCKNKLHISTKYKGFDKILFKTILGYSIWIFLGIVVDKANWSVDQFILGAVSGTIAVSVYSIAATLNQLFISLSSALSGVLLPKMSKLVAKKATSDELTNEFIKVGRLQYYIIFLMCSGLVLFGKNFILLWAGSGYEESYYIALLLIIPLCVPLIQNLGISIMQAMDKYKFKAIISFGMTIINVIISIFLAQKWGATGAALGTCISLVVCNIIIMNIYYYKEIKLDVIKFWKNIFKMTVPFVMPIIVILVFMHFTHFGGIWNFLVYGGVYTLLFCLTSYLFVMNKYEKGIIDKILVKMHLKGVKS